MSEIPYIFETPPPIDFRRNGWFKCDNTLKFVTWAFSRCSTRQREISHDGKRIILLPFQFIFGRLICSTETNMSEGEVRNQQLLMESAGYLKKATNKTPNRFTIYEWTTSAFTQNNNQVNNQVTTNKQPTNNHNLEVRYKKEEEESIATASFDSEKINKLIEQAKEFSIPVTPDSIVNALKLGDYECVISALSQLSKEKKSSKDKSGIFINLVKDKINNKKLGINAN